MKLISVGQLIDQSWEHYRANWRKLIMVSGIMLLPTLVAILATAMYPAASTLLASKDLSAGEISSMVIWFLNNTLLTPIFGLWVFLMTVSLIHAQKESRKITFSTLSKNAWKIFLPIIFVNLLIGLILAGTWLLTVPGAAILLFGNFFDISLIDSLGIFLLVVGVIASFILTVNFVISFVYAPLALIIENCRGQNAIKRARELIRGRFWSVLIRMVVPKLVFILILLIAEWLIGYSIDFGTASLSGSNFDLHAKLAEISVTLSVAIGAILINPLIIISDYLLFDNLRQTKI